MAYTKHGHHIPGTPKEENWDGNVARCGGPRLCDECAKAASMAKHPAGKKISVDVPTETDPQPNVSSFAANLQQLINMHSMENMSDTPDFILAMYLKDCLIAWNKAQSYRRSYFQHDKRR